MLFGSRNVGSGYSNAEPTNGTVERISELYPSLRKELDNIKELYVSSMRVLGRNMAFGSVTGFNNKMYSGSIEIFNNCYSRLNAIEDPMKVLGNFTITALKDQLTSKDKKIVNNAANLIKEFSEFKVEIKNKDSMLRR
jgi:hypothetical protein